MALLIIGPSLTEGARAKLSHIGSPLGRRLSLFWLPSEVPKPMSQVKWSKKRARDL